MSFRRLFIGGYRELRRPVNVIDESLMRRMEQARERLLREGKEARPVRIAGHHSRPDNRARFPLAPRHTVASVSGATRQGDLSRSAP